jgi:hypothetical protein
VSSRSVKYWGEEITLDPIDPVARSCRQFECGLITPEEFVTKLSDYFASDPRLVAKEVVEVAALIPVVLRGPVRRQIEIGLAPGYLRQAGEGGRASSNTSGAVLGGGFIAFVVKSID